MDYSKAIKDYRERNFLTQTDLAVLLGVSFTTVNRWENGKFKPTMKMKKKLNDLFKKEAGN
jgi:DNA-binding XRE family transcriptional regulator